MRWLLWCLLFLIASQGTHAANDDAAAGDDGYYANGDDGSSNTASVYSTGAKVEPCEKGVVQVTSISLLCNSPYTFYYGNGANRQSQVCDYGDKANIEVSFTVTDNLDEGTDVYMKMAVFYGGEQLYRGDSVELCYNFVGGSCTAAGEYTFKKKIQFAYVDGTYTKFVPTLEIAFSDSADGSYRLGGVNIDCVEDEDDDQYIVEWSNSDEGESKVESFFLDFGILIGTVVVISGFALFLFIHNRDGPSVITGRRDPKTVGLMNSMHT
jgi:hypothetical protein